MDDQNRNTVSANSATSAEYVQNGGQNGVPLVFLREESLFGKRIPKYQEFIKHEELYSALSNVIESTHITGLQRVNGMWRIYIDNLTDKARLITEGVMLRGRALPILHTNPLRLDYERKHHSGSNSEHSLIGGRWCHHKSFGAKRH